MHGFVYSLNHHSILQYFFLAQCCLTNRKYHRSNQVIKQKPNKPKQVRGNCYCTKPLETILTPRNFV